MATLIDVMDILLSNVMDEMQKPGGDANFCYVGTYPGNEVPADVGTGSGCGGQLWVRLGTTNGTRTFPSPDITDSTCAYTLAYVLELGIFRTMPLGQNFGGNYKVPEVTANATAMNRMLDDMHAMERAIRRLRGSGEVEQLIIGSYSPIGPAGGVYGGSWSLTVGLD